MLSPGRSTFRYRATGEGKGPALPLEGEAGRIEYDLAAKSAALDGDVVLRLHDPGAPETVLRAAHAELSPDIAVATFTGGLTVTRGEDRLAAPGGRVERRATGAGRLDAGPGAKARLTRPGGAPSTLAEADRITIEEGPAAPGRGKGRIVTLAGNALVEEEAAAPAAASPGAPAAPSAARPPGPSSGRRLGADTITMVEGEAGAPRPVHAEGRVTLRLPAAPGETSPRTMTCAVLDGALEPDGRLRSADAKGGVAIRAGARTATSASARFIGETRVELRGSRPRVEEASRTLVANEIDLARGAGDEAGSSGESLVTARGAVRARFTPRTESSGGPFAPGEPVETSSDQAEFRDGARTALFTGKVVARQAERALSAARLLLNDADRTATAEGAVGLRTFRSEALPAGASAGAPAPASRTAAAKPIPVHVNAEALFHDDRARTTRFEGHAVYREPGRTLAADRITMVGGPDAEASKTAAEGHVTFDGDGKKGEGDRASYDASARTITLTGTERPARVTETATGRTWRGPSLTWSLAPDSIPVASGESGRSTISAPEPAGKSRTRVRSTDGRIAH